MTIEQATIVKWVAGVAGGLIMVLEGVSIKETINVEHQGKQIEVELNDIEKSQAKTLEEILKVIKARDEKDQHGN